MTIEEQLKSVILSRHKSVRAFTTAIDIPYSTLDSVFKRGLLSAGVGTIIKVFNALDLDVESIGTGDLKSRPTSMKKAPSDFSEEAQKIARSYDKMNAHGKGAVKAILSYEEKELSRYTQQEDSSGKVITLPKAKKNRNGFVEFKVYDQPSAAGLGNYLDEPDYHIEQYPEDVIPADADFGIIISGDSMEPKVHDGGTVFVQAMPSIESGKIGIFILNGTSYCKKLNVDRDNRQVRLVSINPEYEDIVVSEFDDLRTVGRVLGQWTPGKRQDLFGW